MAKDFIGDKLRVQDFVILPAQFGVGLRYAVVSFTNSTEDWVSLFTEDQRVAHRSSADCIRADDSWVPEDTRRVLLDGMMGVFHPKEGK